MGWFTRPKTREEWHDGKYHIWDGRTAWRIAQESNIAGDERWLVLVVERGEYGDFWRPAMGSGTFDTYDEAYQYVSEHSWSRA